LSQVAQVGAPTETYTYDAAGNRQSSLGASPYSYNNSNQLTSTPSATFTYDSNGNTLTKVESSGTVITSYAWDFENRMTSVTLPNGGGVVSFQYDPLGRRVQKTFGSSITNYVYDGSGIAEEVNGSGTIVARYAQGVGIDEPLAMSRSGAVLYYHADGLGTITSLTDGSGSAQAAYTYDSFGKPLLGSSITNPFRYTGRELDSETGLYYFRARYYDSGIGRFMSEDPLGTSGGFNLFEYVLNDPINLYDPSGLKGTKPQRPQVSASAVYYICCKAGKLRVCDKNGSAYSGWMSDCMRDHEKQHVTEMCSGGAQPCAGQPDGQLGVPASQKAQLECSAYLGEFKCLSAAPKTKEIQDRRIFITKQVLSFCGVAWPRTR